ncbi:hypothetical protein ADK52_01925 [Streptomyces sp. WM6372]|uniref:hypothetical protein n=1 Tax=Streptomyces sp. WM6372 TaxID=1415555 RepID=UPI0006AF484E|nr:hypothetical protein [Streptomyces sp. WM6372]KOU32283.1 hypothetical protein ADK52_01925 [Streptomyces sp. WM6372]
MNVMKRRLAALVLTSGAALALTPLAAHADTTGPTIEGQPVTKRITDIANHPGQAVDDTKTALAVTTSAAGSATNGSLAGAGNSLDGLPKTPSVS